MISSAPGSQQLIISSEPTCNHNQHLARLCNMKYTCVEDAKFGCAEDTTGRCQRSPFRVLPTGALSGVDHHASLRMTNGGGVVKYDSPHSGMNHVRDL